jgi:hypothetical protein
VVVLFASGLADASLKIDLNRVHYKRQRVVGVVGFKLQHAHRAIELMVAGAVDVDRIRQPKIRLHVGHRTGLSCYPWRYPRRDLPAILARNRPISI